MISEHELDMAIIKLNDAYENEEVNLPDECDIIVPALLELKERRESSLRPATSIQGNAIKAILAERQRQDEKWGEQNHLPQFWTGILGEEYGEFCEAVNETVFNNGEEERKKGGYENMRKEAIHVAAVAVGFLECLERNRGNYNE